MNKEYTNRGFVVAGRVHGDVAASTGLAAQDGVPCDGQLGYGHGGGGGVGNQRWSEAGLQVHMTIYRHYSQRNRDEESSI